MPNILFVCGFTSLGFDTYRNLSYLNNIEYFCYSNSEHVTDIETRLHEKYLAGTYDTLIGHSLGCFMISRLLPKLIVIPKKVILMNPFIQNSTSTTLLSRIPYNVSCLLRVPKWLGFLSDGLTFRGRSIWATNQWKLIRFHQICFASCHMDMAAFLDTYRLNNVVLIYGQLDTCAPLSEKNLSELKKATKLIDIYSKHEPFSDDSSIQTNLKNILLREINTEPETVKVSDF